MPRTANAKIKECGELPSPTGVALQILEISQQEDSNVNAIATEMMADWGMPEPSRQAVGAQSDPDAAEMYSQATRGRATLGQREVQGKAAAALGGQDDVQR